MKGINILISFRKCFWYILFVKMFISRSYSSWRTINNKNKTLFMYSSSIGRFVSSKIFLIISVIEAKTRRLCYLCTLHWQCIFLRQHILKYLYPCANKTSFIEKKSASFCKQRQGNANRFMEDYILMRSIELICFDTCTFISDFLLGFMKGKLLYT